MLEHEVTVLELILVFGRIRIGDNCVEFDHTAMLDAVRQLGKKMRQKKRDRIEELLRMVGE